MIRVPLFSLFLSLALALAQAATAAPACALPPDLTPWPVQTPPPQEIAKVATVFHLLTLSWAPEWCRTNGVGITSQRLQCDGPARGFVLHGLWPNGHGKPYPRYCEPVGGIDVATVRKMFCRTPSAELLQHEWQAHGACGWTDPKAYFAQAATLYDRIRPPRLETIAAGDLTAGTVRKAFVARNPWLKAEQIMIAADSAGRLTEVRLCYGLDFRPAPCPGGNGPPDALPLTLTPSATGRF